MASSRNSPSEAVGRGLTAHVAPGTAVCAGLSGGLDSVVLLHLLVAHREAHGIDLRALHVHHGLSPNADRWAAACERLCAAWKVPLAVERVEVERASGAGLEAAARSARLAAYVRQGAPVVALAHHQDDQAETVLLQMLRGTGLKGASAMPAWRDVPGTATALFRPLLEVPRSELLDYAQAHGLEWVEDESNAQTAAFDRNFIRHEVGALLDARFPGWKPALARFARHAGAALELLEPAGAREHQAEGLSIAGLRAADPAARALILRDFLARHRLAMPTEARLAEMTRQLVEARGDARVRLVHGNAVLVRHRDEVLVDLGGEPDAAWTVAWAGEAEVVLGEDRGAVRFAAVTGEGIADRYTHDGTWRFGPREGGERIRLEAARPTRTLKNLLQETGVPDRERSRLPLLFHGEALVWVPGVGIAAGYRCAAGEPGRLPEWFPGR